MARSDKKTQANVGANCNLPLQSVQPENNPRKSPVGATHRKLYLASLREAYAQKLFSKLMNELSGTLTMKLHKGTWHLVFSCGGENGMIQAKGKTLAHAIINLTAKTHCFTSKKLLPYENNQY